MKNCKKIVFYKFYLEDCILLDSVDLSFQLYVLLISTNLVLLALKYNSIHPITRVL